MREVYGEDRCYKEEKAEDWEDENKMKTNVYIAMLAVFAVPHRLAK